MEDENIKELISDNDNLRNQISKLTDELEMRTTVYTDLLNKSISLADDLIDSLKKQYNLLNENDELKQEIYKLKNKKSNKWKFPWK